MNTVTVKINGIEYNLRGKENEKYLFDVAAYVDSKFKEIAANNSKLSTSSVAVLAALNVADELFKCDLEYQDIARKKSSLEERHQTLKERIKEIKAEVEESIKVKDDEIQQLKDYICSMEENIKEANKIKSEFELQEEKLKVALVENNNLKVEIVKVTNESNALKEKIENSINKDKYEDLEKKYHEAIENQSSLEENLKLKEIEFNESQEVLLQKNNNEIIDLKDKLVNTQQELKKNIDEKESLKVKNKEMKFQLQNSKYKVLDLEKKLIDAQFNLAVEKKTKNPLLK